MNQKLTEIVFLLDRSGSMKGLEADTIGGYNSFIEHQKQIEGEANLTTVLFDDRYQLLHDRANIKEVRPLKNEYYVRGSTALLDAIGRTIDDIGAKLNATDPELRPHKVVFVITTDGMENASKAYSLDAIKQKISHQTEKYSWEFIFLGANIDAISTAKSIGICPDNAANFRSDKKGVKLSYESISAAISSVRCFNSIDKDWKVAIENDFSQKYSDADSTMQKLEPNHKTLPHVNFTNRKL